MKTPLLISILALASLYPIISMAQADESVAPLKEEVTLYKHGVGLAAGFTSAYGLSYRFFPRPFGFQVTFFPFRDKSNETHNYYTGTTQNEIKENYNLGFVFLWQLKSSDIISFYTYQSNYYRYERNQTSYVLNSVQVTDIDESRIWNHGIGLGIEAMGAGNITANFMVGYGFYNNFDDINVTAEIAFYYTFE
ncbi:MAG: hypothetical protein RIE58_09835 [Vicingaceae bacterium]